MAVIGGLIAGGAALVGDAMSQSGQQQTNAMQQSNMLQQENWQENMSNTAMQRRVTDLKAAGLNPLLAVGTSGAQVGSVGQPNLQNPDAAFGQLGAQATGAVNTVTNAAQIQAYQAQAQKASAEAAVTAAQIPTSGATAQANLDLMNTRMKEAWNNAALIEQNYAKAGAELSMLNRNDNFQQQFLELRNQLSALDVQRMQLGMPRLEDDAAWQKAHPTLSGWLQSGTSGALSNITSAASKMPAITGPILP